MELWDFWVLSQGCSKHVQGICARLIGSTVIVGSLVINIPAVYCFLTPVFTFFRRTFYRGDEVLGGLNEKDLPFAFCHCLNLHLNRLGKTLLQIFVDLSI